MHRCTWILLLLMPPGICGGSAAKASVARLCKSHDTRHCRFEWQQRTLPVLMARMHALGDMVGRKPPHSIIKLNVDVALDEDRLDGAIGAVPPDHKGEFVAAANQKFTRWPTVPVAEVMTLRLSLELAHTAGCSRLLVTLDSMDVVDAINRGGNQLLSVRRYLMIAFRLF